MARNTAMQTADQTEAANQQMPDDSSGLKRSGSTAISLLFSLDDASEKMGSSATESMQEYEPVLEVQRIKHACALSESEQKLFHAVSEAKASSVLTFGSVQLSHVGSYLRSKYGYLVVMRNANIAKRPRSYLRMLRHKCLVCRGLEGMEGVDVLVDLNFKDHFILPHSCSWYAKLVAALPQDWVGTAAALAPLVGLMSAGMRLCFKQAGIPLPPWREGRAVLSKWVPEMFEDLPLPLVPVPDSALRRILAPYHAPFRAALRTAGVTAESATPPSIKATAYNSSVSQPELPPGSSGKPPLPRPPSGVALATASVKAAAAGAAGALLAARGSYTGVGGSNQGVHAPVVPDVPRKIIVGFPDQNFLPTAMLQRLPAACEAPTAPAGTYSDGGETGDAGVLVVRQLHPQAGAAEQGQPQQQHLHRTHAAGACSVTMGSAITSMLAQQGGANVYRGRYVASLKTVPQQTSAETLNLYAAEGAASQVEHVAKQADNQHQQRQQQPNQQQQQQLPHKARARPAFTSTVGVVTAICGNSPGIVINQQLLQQLQAPAAAVGEGQDRSVAAGEQRQFKALDQLLPRMRTVRLGAA